jgi:hypothetical protein
LSPLSPPTRKGARKPLVVVDRFDVGDGRGEVVLGSRPRSPGSRPSGSLRGSAADRRWPGCIGCTEDRLHPQSVEAIISRVDGPDIPVQEPMNSGRAAYLAFERRFWATLLVSWVEAYCDARRAGCQGLRSSLAVHQPVFWDEMAVPVQAAKHPALATPCRSDPGLERDHRAGCGPGASEREHLRLPILVAIGAPGLDAHALGEARCCPLG